MNVDLARGNSVQRWRWGLLIVLGGLAGVSVLPKSALGVLGLIGATAAAADLGLWAARRGFSDGVKVARASGLLGGAVALTASLTGRWGGEALWPLPVLALLAEAVAYRRGRALWMGAAGYGVLVAGAFLGHLTTPAQAFKAALSVALGAAVSHILSGLKGRDDRLDVGERRLSAVVESVTSLASSPDLSTMLATSLRVALQESAGTAGYVLLTNENEPDQLYAEVAAGREEFAFPQALVVGEGLSGYVVQMRQLVAMGNREGRGECDGIDLGSRSAVSLPLLAREYQDSTSPADDQILGALTIIGPEGRPDFDGADLQVLQSIGSMMAVAVANARMESRRRTTFLRTLESLATALEARDEYTRGHSQRVCEVSMLIGEALGFTPEALEELRIGTILHDIGKIGVRDNILNKDARLNDDEFAIMKTHPVIGYEICKPLMLSEGVLMIIRNHHEKLDGSGYPDGLKGGELPPPLRVVCVADAFDAMSSRRPYRNVMAIEKVVAELSKGAGIQFDPVIVETLKNLIATDRLRDVYRQYWDTPQEGPPGEAIEERRAA